MAFRIEYSRVALQDIIDAFDFIAKDSQLRSQNWTEGLFELVETLMELPERHELIREAKKLQRQLRSIHYHSHRIIYEVQVERNTVFIVRVYHGARRPLAKKDVD